ncbi:MAG TPA: fatty acid desaturase family protein [Caulobacteraceae bacterium]|nr:fatty acid desaturase family protein [Caulobacteraceae bacterium]
MAVAARVNPKDFFTAEEWAPLAERSSWKGLVLVAHCWAVIGLATLMGLFFPITIPIAVMIIGARQLGLGILQHDAAHSALHGDPKVNLWVGEYLCGGGVERYRKYHLQHHKYAQQSEDPDLGLSAPFPITRASMRRKVIRDLTGQTWFKQRFGLLQANLKQRPKGAPVLPIVWADIRRQHRFFVTNLIAIAGFGVAGMLVGRDWWWGWFALWLLPRATWFQMVTRFRNIAEHALVAKDEPDPLKHARTTMANWLERALIAPYYVNYHCEHHMFMHVPCYHLPRVHKLLGKKGVLERMEIAPNYPKMLAAASAA